MSDDLDVNPESPDAAPAAIEAAPVEVAPKQDFGNHPAFASMLAHIEEFSGAAIGRATQILEELRALMNQHGL